MDKIRPFQPLDFDACMALFDANVPAFFSAGERVDFAGFLIQYATAWHYQLLERDNQIAGCAGYAISADGITASLCWGMVHPGLHRRGVGTQLLLARLDALRRMPDVRRVVLDTSQHTQQFYARFGFVVQQVTEDGYAPGLERWDMALDLQSCARPTGRARSAK
ncbi:GNAT family N-acetyltransferase [Xanthomonas campestris pv. asclepiadis]|uniref:GNAT family N-acetyltransferase n=1 Tax=Xanthomonas campestris TaxID=339 RepID=UPI001E5869B0|nr:GNAT family N-acetyltransferase [Xanthomonas campestris]MCC4615915.1 GNAT family N-acetyltransferase [Xanthomonas campestris pv. asclepiadis]